jgi:transmembrane sensor
MSSEELPPRERQRAWTLLGAVESHPRVQEWLQRADAHVHDDDGPCHVRRSYRVSRASIAAALVLAALGIGVGTYLQRTAGHYETRIGEQRDVLLADGSRVTLNTDTALAVRFSEHRRYVELEHGEALFQVKHEVTRPFDVAAGGILTRALGTEFNVDLRSTRVTVSVLDGAVRVTPSAGLAGAPGEAAAVTALSKGEALEFRPGEHSLREQRADLKRIDAWQTRRLEFNDTPLSDAVEEVNRYSTIRITVGSADLAPVRVSGVFRTGDTTGFLFSLRAALGVETHQAANEVVLMRSRIDAVTVAH